MSNSRLGSTGRADRPEGSHAWHSAAYACHPAGSRGRRYLEPPSRLRSPFQRDRDRIVHSTAFRRLEYKTQVFVNHEGDHFRTRLTHTLEVAQIARTAARVLGLDEDLAEAVALAHDLGHSPFGHAGELALDAVLAEFGGFDHNAQTLRVVTHLERRYAGFDGLNLSWETLEGVVKHNGPVDHQLDRPAWRAIADYTAGWDLRLDTFASLEAQCAAVADDIAYNNHDVDDGVQAGLFALAELNDVPLIGPILNQTRKDWPDLDERMIRLEAVRRMIGAMVDDVLAETERRLEADGVRTPEDVRAASRTLVQFSDAMLADLGQLRAFLMPAEDVITEGSLTLNYSEKYRFHFTQLIQRRGELEELVHMPVAPPHALFFIVQPACLAHGSITTRARPQPVVRHLARNRPSGDGHL